MTLPVESWDESAPVPLCGWYIVTDTSGTVLQLNQSLVISGAVFLILADGANIGIVVNYEPGIRLEGSNSLTIYGQAEGTGNLSALGVYNAGIGGDGGGILTVYGGEVRGIGRRGGAGIGGNGGKDGCTVNIYGGKTRAISQGSESAGMGGGRYYDTPSGNGGTVNIYGGEVTATEGGNGAGIGGSYGGNGGTVSIYGGTVVAESSVGGAGIGSGKGGHGGTVNIHGGVVTAESAYCPGIGGCSGGTVNITGGEVTAFGYYLGAAIGSCRDSDVPITINISGGTVIAKGGLEGGWSGDISGVGIGGGVGSVGGDVNIFGGSVLAKGLSSGCDIFGTLRNRSDGEEVFLTTVTMKNAADLPVDSARISSLFTTLGGAAYEYGITDMAVDEGKLYLYLPSEAETVAAQTTDSAASPPRRNYYGSVLTGSTGGSGTLTFKSRWMTRPQLGSALKIVSACW